MLNVLIVESAGSLWGSERALLDMIDGLGPERVAVCCPSRTPLASELRRRGVTVYPDFVADLHHKSRWRRLQAALGVLRACRHFRPDVIHLNQAGSYRVALLAATLLRIPIVAHVRLYEDAAYLERRANVGRLAGMIAISHAVEAEIRQFTSLDAIPVLTAYDAYRPAIIDRSGESERRSRHLAIVGRIVEIKGHDILIESLARLGTDHITCAVAGGGEGEFAKRIDDICASRPAIERLGIVEDVMPVLRRAAFLVCPSWREPLGRVIFEAWDAGAVPVVYAGSGGAAEVVQAADGGILYDEQTPQALAAALRSVIALPPGERARLIANGRAWLAENCDPAAYGARIGAILKQAAQR